MNITKQQLKQIIHEESQTVLKEFEPKRSDQNLSPVELAQRKAKQAQMKKDYAAREKVRAAKDAKSDKAINKSRKVNRKQDPDDSAWTKLVRAAKHAKSEKGIKDKRAVRKSARDAANLEDVEMHDAPIQGAETDDDVVRDLVRSNARRFNAKQYMHSPSKIRDVVKRARQFEAKFTKQQLEQLIKEELQLFLGEDMAAKMAALEAEMAAGMDFGEEEAGMDFGEEEAGSAEDLLASYDSPQLKKIKAQFPKLALFPGGKPHRGAKFGMRGPHGAWRGAVGDPEAPRWVQVQYKDWAQGIPYVVPPGLSGRIKVEVAQYLQELMTAAGGTQP